MAIAVFDFSAWQARYPEFAAVSSTLAGLYFAEATIHLDNSDTSIVQDVGQRLVLLNMLVAHIAALNGGLGSGGAAAGTVGRVSSATEGSAAVQFDSGLAPGTAPWFQQTQYGLSFWQATRSYRSATYIPNPTPFVPDPWASMQWQR